MQIRAMFYVLLLIISILQRVVSQPNANGTAEVDDELDCVDRYGHQVASGMKFAPDEDPCKTCYCVDGVAQLCTMVQCSPPSCQRWEPVFDQCCKFRCLDWPLFGDSDASSKNGLDGPSFHLRLALSGTTSLLIVALLIFMVHRLRQRRLILMRRISEEQRCIDHDDSPCTADTLTGFDFLAFKEPPPPYSSPDQSVSPHSDPPPYESASAMARQDTNTMGHPGVTSVNQSSSIGNYNEAVCVSPAVVENQSDGNVSGSDVNASNGFRFNV